MKSETLSKLPLFFCSLSLLWLALTVIIGGSYYPDYDHVSQFMSELGAVDSPIAFYINYFGFVPTEIFIFFFIYYSYQSLPKSSFLSIGMSGIFIYALALLLDAHFNCDARCRPDSPSMSHQIHIILGAIAYISVAFSILILSLDAKKWSTSSFITLSGIIIAVITFTLFSQLDANVEWVGIIQRILEFFVYCWFILFSIGIKKHASQHPKS